ARCAAPPTGGGGDRGPAPATRAATLGAASREPPPAAVRGTSRRCNTRGRAPRARVPLLSSSRRHTPRASVPAAPPDLRARICVRPPYFALTDLALAGLDLHATALAESPAGLEVGPMPAAELGRHAAIVGLSLAACSQADDARRYYLARRAE